METTILRALRADTQAWWAHRALRDAGEMAEAGRRERASIQRDAEHLRAALLLPNAYVSQGRGGTTVHLGNTRISSHGRLEHFAMARVAVALGVPFVDFTGVDDGVGIWRLPLVTCDGRVDPEPWHSLSYVPLVDYLDRAALIGARILNAPSSARAA